MKFAVGDIICAEHANVCFYVFIISPPYYGLNNNYGTIYEEITLVDDQSILYSKIFRRSNES